MPGTRLDLVELNVSDWRASVDWYRRSFDLDVAYEDDQHQWCELSFAAAGPRFALRGGADPAPSKNVVLSVEVDGLDAAVETLKERGVELTSAIKEATRPTGQGYRWANLADPEGNLLRVFEWTASD
jgi:predicted enzyme related to lactoylglutathione lyase